MSQQDMACYGILDIGIPCVAVHHWEPVHNWVICPTSAGPMPLLLYIAIHIHRASVTTGHQDKKR